MSAEERPTYSTKHPHEPEIPPTLDSEGRCLVCGLLVELEESQQREAKQRKEFAKDLSQVREDCAEVLRQKDDLLRQSQQREAALREALNDLQAWLGQGVASRSDEWARTRIRRAVEEHQERKHGERDDG